MRCPGRNATSPCGHRGACDAATGCASATPGSRGSRANSRRDGPPRSRLQALASGFDTGASRRVFPVRRRLRGTRRDRDADEARRRRSRRDRRRLRSTRRTDGDRPFDGTPPGDARRSRRRPPLGRRFAGHARCAARRKASLDDGGYLVATAADFDDGSATLRVSAARAPGRRRSRARVVADGRGSARARSRGATRCMPSSPNPRNRCERPVASARRGATPSRAARESSRSRASSRGRRTRSSGWRVLRLRSRRSRGARLDHLALDPAASYFPAARP